MSDTWNEAFAKLRQLDGEEWDTAHHRLRQEWHNAYEAAFRRVADERGWDSADAESWLDAGDLAEEAFIALSHRMEPDEAAEDDVRQLEIDISHA